MQQWKEAAGCFSCFETPTQRRTKSCPNCSPESDDGGLQGATCFSLPTLAEWVAAVISLPPKEAVLLELLQALLESIFLLLKELRLQHLTGFLMNPRKSLLAGHGSGPRAELDSGRTQRWHIILLHQHKAGGAHVPTKQEIRLREITAGLRTAHSMQEPCVLLPYGGSTPKLFC